MTAMERMLYEIERQGRSQADLCRYLGIKTSIIAGWKKQNDIPPAWHLVGISEFLGVSIDYLLTGAEFHKCYNTADGDKAFFIPQDSDRADYKNSVCQVDYAPVGERFMQARQLSGRTLEQAAASAYLKPEVLKRIEEESEFSTKDIGPEQVACLAYLYDVDLYWLFSGKTRPPAAVLKDGAKAYPPYEFMLEQAPVPAAAGPTTTAAASMKLSEDELDLLDTYSYLNNEGKKDVHTFLHFQLFQSQNLSSSSSLNHDENKGKLA